MCLHKSSRLLNVGSKDGSREELACESLFSGTSSSTKISLNSCSHSGISELARFESADNGSPRSILVSICFGIFGIFGWLGSARIGECFEIHFPR